MRHVIAPDEKYVCPEREPDFSSLSFAFSTFPPVGETPAEPTSTGPGSGSLQDLTVLLLSFTATTILTR